MCEEYKKEKLIIITIPINDFNIFLMLVISYYQQWEKIWLNVINLSLKQINIVDFLFIFLRAFCTSVWYNNSFFEDEPYHRDKSTRNLKALRLLTFSLTLMSNLAKTRHVLLVGVDLCNYFEISTVTEP